MSKILFIDTKDNKRTVVRIVGDGQKFEEVSEGTASRADETLLLINAALEKSDLDLAEIDEIQVMRGPGSFTGLRVGISIANALSFVLQKPVNGKLGTFEEPRYTT